MNNNSLICKYILEHKKESLLDIFNKKKIRTVIENNYILFSCGRDTIFNDPISREANQTIIIDMNTLDVVSWAIKKFARDAQRNVFDINWENVSVYEKYDGVSVFLWFDNNKNIWRWSNDISIDLKNITTKSNISYLDLLYSAINYKNIDFDNLDKSNTYIFELVSPYNRIVVLYPETKLYHIGTKNNITGKESDTYIGIDKPKKYNLHSYDECMTAKKKLNYEYQNTEPILHEGFIACDNNFNRMSFNCPSYSVYLLEQRNKKKKIGKI